MKILITPSCSPLCKIVQKLTLVVELLMLSPSCRPSLLGQFLGKAHKEPDYTPMIAVVH